MQPPPPRPPLPLPNPVTQRQHRREAFWQIWLPFGAGVVVLIAVMAGAALAGPAQASLWADISLIWLILPMLLVLLLFLAITAGMAYGVTQLLKVTPRYTHRLLQIFRLVDRRVRQGCDAAVEPVLRARGAAASAQKLGEKLTGRRPRG